MEETSFVEKRKSHSLFNKISYIVLLVMTFLTPIFFVPAAFISNQFGTSLLFAFGTILSILTFIISSLLSGSMELPKPLKYVLGFTALVPLMYTLAGISNGFSRMTFLGYTFDINTVGFIVLAFVYMFLVSLLFRDKNRIFYSYLIFVASSLILALFILIRIIFGAKVLSFGIFTELNYTMLGNWNNVGIFFGITAMLSLLTYEMLHLSKLVKVLMTIALALSLFFLAIVNFNAIWVIIAVCSLLYIIYNIFNSHNGGFAELSIKQKISRVPLYTFIVFVISILFVIWGSSIGGFLTNKLKVSNYEVRPTMSVTLEIAKNTIKEHPLFGSSPNTFVTQWLTFKPDDITSTVYWNTDFTNGIGLIPTFAVTTGLFGILSWLIFFGFFVYLGVKSIFAKAEDKFVKYLLVSSFFTSLYLWIMTFFYVPSTAIFILTFFFTGLFFASVYVVGLIPISSKTFTHNPRVGFVSSFVMVVVFVSCVALGYGLFKNSQSLWFYQKSSYTLSNSGDITSAESYMAKAIAAVPYDIYYRALSEIELYKINAIVSQDQNKVKLEDIQKQFSDALPIAINAGLAARNADSGNYLNWIALGKVYESIVPYNIQGAYESAQLAYTEALRRNPKNPGILVLFARLAATNKDLKAARNYAMQAIQVKQNYLDAYYLLTQIEVADNNLKGAIDSMTAESILSPSDPTIFFQLGVLKYDNKDIPGAIEALEHSLTLSPQYANAKYFLGLSYELDGQHEKAIAQFEDLKVSNPDSKEVDMILSNLKEGNNIFTDTSGNKTETTNKLPVKENQ